MSSPGWSKTKIGSHPTPEFARPDIDAFAAANASKTLSKYLDPCENARRESMKCLDDNLYDRNKCIDCKQYVSEEMAKRKWA